MNTRLMDKTPKALGNGAGAVWSRIRVIQAAVIAVHRTHDRIDPYCQNQCGEAQIHGEQQHSTDKNEDRQRDVFTIFLLYHEPTPAIYFLTHSYSYAVFISLDR